MFNGFVGKITKGKSKKTQPKVAKKAKTKDIKPKGKKKPLEKKVKEKTPKVSKPLAKVPAEKKKLPKPKKQPLPLPLEELDDLIELEDGELVEAPETPDNKYVFKNFYESETQLRDITHKSNPEAIIKAYTRLIWVHAANHVREGVEIEDLFAEGQRGICEAIKEFNDIKRKKPNYNFHQACLYKIRSSIFQYCLRNATQIKTPYYIQRGCMHVGQIFKLMNNQSVAEALLKKKGPASEQDIIDFIYDEKERLPLKSMKFIKAQITKDVKSKTEFNQILNGILNHELGSRHSYVKNNLTDIGRCLHIKEKLYYSSSSNNMNYARVVQLILSSRQSKTELNLNTYSPHYDNLETIVGRREMVQHGKDLCGAQEFDIFLKNKVYDKTYDEVAKEYKLKKIEVVETIRECIRKLRKDELFQEMFNSL